jgi:hypothetical protein
VAAQEAVDAVKKQAEDERQRGGCAKECKNREKDERIARTALAAAHTNRAATIRAADLDAKIAAAEEALDRVDIKAVIIVADPQSASMAKVIGADQNLIAALSHAVHQHRTRERRRVLVGVRAWTARGAHRIDRSCRCARLCRHR